LKPSDAIQLVRYLRKEGVSFLPDDVGNISVCPAGLLTPEHRALIKVNKPAVIAYLRTHAKEMLPDEETLRRWQAEGRRQAKDKTS
jgi:hypothetical protein